MREQHTLEEIVHRYYDRVFAYCLSIVMNRERAEDACHDVFLKVQKNIDRLDHDRNCIGWLLRITRNHCYDICRKEKRVVLREDLGNTLPGKSMGPEESLLAKEELSVVVEALNGLQPAYREVLALRDIDGFSYQEIARILEMDRKRVKWMLYKARQQIKRIVGGWDEES